MDFNLSPEEEAFRQEVRDFLAETGGVKDIVDSFPPGKDEVRPKLDLERGCARQVSWTLHLRRPGFLVVKTERIHVLTHPSHGRYIAHPGVSCRGASLRGGRGPPRLGVGAPP